MFGAIGRWIKAILYLLTGQLDSARQTLDRDPNVIKAKYAHSPFLWVLFFQFHVVSHYALHALTGAASHFKVGV